MSFHPHQTNRIIYLPEIHTNDRMGTLISFSVTMIKVT